jgi:hypothetical protein
LSYGPAARDFERLEKSGMLGRALSLAAVTLLVGCFAVHAAWAQNLEAGKSPYQLFAGTCNACHKSPRGLLKTVSAGSLPSFLRQHYTTSGDMASQLSGFLIANGASARQGGDAKPTAGTDQVDRQGGRRQRAGTSQEAAKPDGEGVLSQGHRRLATPGEVPDAGRTAADGQPPPGTGDRGPDGRRLSAKQRLSKRSRPGEEVPSAKEEPQKLEPAAEDRAKAETAKEEDGKTDVSRPSIEDKAESPGIEPPKDSGGETAALRPDPTPAVTPVPPAASPAPPQTASIGSPEPVAASAPQPSEPPPAPAGPPVPPISQ